MEFSDEQTRLAKDLIIEAVLRRQKLGAPIPQQVRDLLNFMSARGHENRLAAAESEAERDHLVNTEGASQILGCTTRHVRRIATDLDGAKRGRDWIFNQHNVIEYAEGRNTQCQTPHSAA